MQELSEENITAVPEASSQRRWPLFAGLTVLLILVLCALWFIWLSSMVGGLAILYKTGFLCTAAIGIIALVVYRKELVAHPERPFLVILLAITCSSSWVYDTNEVSWDLESHFWYMLAYSEPDRTYVFTEASKSVETRSIDFSDYDVESTLILEEAIAAPDGSIDFGPIHIFLDTNALQVKDSALNGLDSVEDDEHGVILGPLSDLYKHVSSLPASLIYAFLTLLGIPFVLKFVLAKMVYAIIYSLILYSGMRRLRSGKILFAVVALYPTAVFLAANYSYDYWVNAWSMYAVAAIVGQLQTPDTLMRPADMVKVLGAFVIGLAPKAIYFPLIALAFLIPKSKFASAMSRRLFRVAICLAVMFVMLSFVIPLLIVAPDSSSDLRGGSDVSASGQIAFILSHPLTYAKTCLLFIFDYLSIPRMQDYSTTAAYLGYGGGVAWILILIITLFATVTDTGADSSLMDRWFKKFYVVVLLFFTLVLAVTALYVSFTSVGLDTVEGFRGRYFLPLLFPLLIFMGTRRSAWPRSLSQRCIVSACILLVMLAVNYYFVWDVYVGLLN